MINDSIFSDEAYIKVSRWFTVRLFKIKVY